MARFSKRPHCRASVFPINLGILGNLALVLRQAPRTSLSSTSQDCIISQSTTVNAETSLCPVGSTTTREMVSSDAFASTNSFHLQLPWNVSWTHITRENQLVWLLLYSPLMIQQFQLIHSSCTSNYLLFFVTHSDFSLVLIFRDSLCISNVEEFDDPQTIWSWSQSSRSCWDISRRVDGRMSSLPSS